jgi:hypothetical protein
LLWSLTWIKTGAAEYNTGNTYYHGRIWLNAPDSISNSYDVSIRRLAALMPIVKIVRRVPRGPPSILPRLGAAFDAVRSGKISATPASPGKVQYKVDDFSFLMSSPKP